MIRLYRLSELRPRYPSSSWVLETDAGLRAELKNPLAPDWWRRWVFAREWAGMRRAGLREGLRLVRVSRPQRPGRMRGGPPSALWPEAAPPPPEWAEAGPDGMEA